MTAVHPSDLQLVDTWASMTSGRVLDAGCGPGHWTNYLHNHGVDVYGLDVVPEFVEKARIAYPAVRFDLGSIDAIDEPDDSLAGILSWSSTIHHEPSQIAIPLAEIEPFDHAVVRAYRWPASELSARLEDAGFDIIETHHRTARGRRDVGALLCELRTR